MNLSALDLNLLVALDALVSEAHVGRAALRIGLSQPAMSHALRRLREILHDPLLVRVGPGMELTPRAQGLRAPLKQTLESVRGLFVADGFDPASSTRRFALMIPDYIINFVLPPLVGRIAAEAPGVRLDVTPWRGAPLQASGAIAPDIARRIDFAFNCRPGALPGFHRQRLFGDVDMLAVRRGHPQAARLKQMKVFLAARHVAVIGRGQDEDLIDSWLQQQGIQRRIALSVPSYLQALHTVAQSDLVAFVPGRLIASLSRQLDLVALAPPLQPEGDEEYLFWPVRHQNDPGSLWLRRHILAVGRDLDKQKPKTAQARR
ncbi:LysR family transcriptional regulator [Ferrovibrio terrae]|uniref:LysR family transcriptional regulator n=1 Tax=Ferrovibrio terrae TaxID=2594003 RepID=UPI003137DECF